MKEFGEFIIFILGGLGKFLKIVLFKIGMWVPLVFSTLFLVVIAITKTPFETVAGLFWFGVILTALLSLVATIGFAIARGKKKKEDARSTQSAVKPKNDEQPTPPPVPPYAYGYGYPVPPAYMPYQPPAQGYPPYPQQPPQPQDNGYAPPPQQPQQSQPAPDQPTFTAPERPSFAPTESERPSFDGFTRRARFDEGFSAESYSCPQGRPPESERPSFDGYSPRRPLGDDRATFGDTQTEKPKIFKTRKDPSILIYDYSNRVEFYRQTPTGLQFLYKEMK